MEMSRGATRPRTSLGREGAFFLNLTKNSDVKNGLQTLFSVKCQMRLFFCGGFFNTVQNGADFHRESIVLVTCFLGSERALKSPKARPDPSIF